MKKIIGAFTVKADVNNSFIAVYQNGEMMKGISCYPAQLDDKFKEVCLQVEKHVATGNKK
jgi:hypothetical protein